MNFNILFGFCLLFCVSTLAQDGGSVSPADLQRAVGAVTDKVKAVEAKLQDTQTRLQESENQIKELKKKEDTKVVFSAASGGPGSGENLGPFNTDTTVIFKRVITNMGDAYNVATGIFTAPVAGVYYFSMFLHAGGSSTAGMHLYKNTEVMLHVYDHASTADTADNGGNAGFLQLQPGDQVYVRLPANSHLWVNDHVTTFNGFLVHQV